MPLATLLNPDDPLFAFEHMMQHREYFSVMSSLTNFSVLPYFLDPPIAANKPGWPWNQRHQQAHDDFNIDLPASWETGYTLTNVTPAPPAPPYVQANPIPHEFGIRQSGILREGPNNTRESLSWWTFVNHQQHFIVNAAILPLPTQAPTTAGTGPGVESVSDPWWWAQRAPVKFPFW